MASIAPFRRLDVDWAARDTWPRSSGGIAMVNRVLLMLGLLAGLLMAGFVAVVLVIQEPTGPGVTKANCDQIKEGMSDKEVRALLGKSPASQGKVVPGELDVWWRGPEGSVAVTFNQQGNVIQKAWHPNNESFVGRARRSIGL